MSEKREAFLRELKKLKEELLKENAPQETIKKQGKNYQKKVSGIASKLYPDQTKEDAKIQVLMLAFLTFLFETIFVVGTYLFYK